MAIFPRFYLFFQLTTTFLLIKFFLFIQDNNQEILPSVESFSFASFHTFTINVLKGLGFFLDELGFYVKKFSNMKKVIFQAGKKAFIHNFGFDIICFF